MKFDHIIMNAPYLKSLHLKILREAIKYSDEIINLSPIRWLQDPLAEYKRGSDWKKFGDVRERIESLDVVSCEESNKLFGISWGDLGIYKVTLNGGWENNLNKVSPFAQKIIAKAAVKSIMDISTEEGWRGNYKESGLYGIINSHYGDIKHFIKDDYELFVKARYTNTNKVLFFKTEEERHNMFLYLSSKLMDAFAKEVRVNQRVPWQFVPVLPTYSHPWTDADLYEYFSLTKEEIKEIEEEMK